LDTVVYPHTGSGGLTLKEHLGHTIEVTGAFADRDTEGPARSTTENGTDNASANAEISLQDRPTVVVRTARHLFDDCLPQLRR
jgi:hypothetical protein